MSTQESAAPYPIRPPVSPVEEIHVFPRALPTPLMPFVGRADEMRRSTAALVDPATRLLTLTGPGGVGKTRLAISLAHAVLARFPHGVVFVPLADIREPGLVLPAIARALDIQLDVHASMQDLLTSAIGSLRVLLVLDNLEHLGDIAADVAGLLQHCPHLTVLATSRVPLHIRGEHELSLHPLALPGRDADFSTAEGSDAVAFFLQVARTHVSDFDLTEDNLGVVVDICRRLEGLPLAIELAASRLRMFSPTTLLRVLDRRLDVLVSGPRDLPPRQRTLRDTIRWSYDLLDLEDRAYFRRLAVFAGSFTLEMASGVLGIAEGVAMETVRRLVDHHLVWPVPADEPRFRMLETIREFALETLEDAGERHALETAHAVWCRSLAMESVEALTGIRQGAWLDRLDAGHDDLRAAMAWGNAQAPEISLQIAAALWRFWIARGHVREGREWIRRALAVATDVPPADRAMGLYAAAELAEALMNLPEAIELYTEGRDVFAMSGDDTGIARCLNGLGIVARTQGRLVDAEELHHEALRHLERSGDRRETAVTLNSLATVAYYRGDPAGAECDWEHALAIAREVGDIRAVGMLSGNLGAAAMQRGDHARAAELHEQNLHVARELRDPASIARALINLGSTHTEMNDLDQARGYLEDGLYLARDIEETALEPVALYTLGRVALLSQDYLSAASWFGESLEMMARTGQLPGVATVMEGIGHVASSLGRHEDAVGLFLMAGRIREETGSAQESDDPLLARAIATSREVVGAKAIRALQERAEAQTVEVAVEVASRLAVQLVDDAPTPPVQEPDRPAWLLAQRYGLTRRESEILGYLVDHRSDREIGDMLFISPRTVGTHVTSIRNKMGVTSRREAARIADQMGIGARTDAAPNFIPPESRA
jgi:predicted ATPase/DNA-binding CsgD family transcriptional regulator/Tfp pilus assembly protein PilF